VHLFGGELSLALKIHNVIDERRILPRLRAAESLVQRDNVRRGLLDDSVAGNLQLTKDGRLS
jgi:hypothetical protein